MATSPPPPRAAPSEGSWVMAPIKELLVFDLEQETQQGCQSHSLEKDLAQKPEQLLNNMACNKKLNRSNSKRVKVMGRVQIRHNFIRVMKRSLEERIVVTRCMYH
jgi:hypothetical protein